MEEKQLREDERWAIFWERRWAADGARGGVSYYQRDENGYRERNERDEERLLMAFAWTGKIDFDKALEVGCGAGRLTPVMLAASKHLICVDGSATARDHFRERQPDLEHHVTLIKNIPDVLPAGTFDMAMTFTVVQHINDRAEWDASLKAIQAMLKPGGFYVMHEDISAHIQGKKAAIHMNERSLEDYQAALDQCELVNHELLHFEPTNEDDLLAVWRKKG